ncbi:MAG: preprotein translocase subunit YajC [Marmoricola sp.]
MSPQYTPILLLAALAILFWLVVLRPARRQQSATAEIQRNLAVGDDVVLSAGIFGTIAGMDDARVQLEIAPGTVIEVARQVVVRRVDDEPTSDLEKHDQTEDPPEDTTDDPDNGPNQDRPQAG